LARKAELIEALGVEELVVVKFDPAFAQLTPADFCAHVLSRRLGARLVLVGENFRFGHHAAGGPADLQEYGRRHGFDTVTVALSQEDGETISSTRIRHLIGAGHVAEAARLLGRPHRIEGLVVAGMGRGRTLSAPTANLAVEPETALPRQGVYVTRSILPGASPQPSLTSVGTNPTFEADRQVRVETLLLDYSGDIYGSHMAVEFLDWIRGQQKFSTADALAERIRLDVEVARGYLGSRGAPPA
jgi:riboflavin kinase/FMN adenylyltransferase